MALILDDITRRKLVLGQQLFQEAVLRSQHHSIKSRILAVISFDLATETVLRATTSALDPAKTSEKEFQSLVQQCDAALVRGGFPPLPDKANIQHVHNLRNDAQHKARYPNEVDIGDSRTYTRDFLQKHIKNVWDEDFMQLRQTSLVQDDKVREYLSKAEEDLSQGNIDKAVYNAGAGLSWALRNKNIQIAVVGPPLSSLYLRGFAVIDTVGRPGDEYESSEALRALEKMQEVLLYITLGLNYADYLRFQKIAGSFSISDDDVGNWDGKNNISITEAEFVLAFCIDSVLQIEERVGSLQKPFGSNLWY